jgi:hypothetical protein
MCVFVHDLHLAGLLPLHSSSGSRRVAWCFVSLALDASSSWSAHTSLFSRFQKNKKLLTSLLPESSNAARSALGIRSRFVKLLRPLSPGPVVDPRKQKKISHEQVILPFFSPPWTFVSVLVLG